MDPTMHHSFETVVAELFLLGKTQVPHHDS